MVWMLTGGVLTLFYTILLLYFRRKWDRLKKDEVPAGFSPKIRFSVIVPARNEEQNVASCLQSIKSNDYPASLYEIMVVDDFSDDQTPQIVRQEGVRLIQLKDSVPDKLNSYKKKAIETGIAAAAGSYIVTTDADSTVSPQWLRTLAWIIETKAALFIAAPVRMKFQKGFFQRFQVLDFLSLQAVTAAAASSNTMSLCNGANLCYSKKTFQEVGGFEGIDKLASGDDLLLMHKVSVSFPGRLHYCLSESVIAETLPEPTVRAFLQQRIRWASKALVYQDLRIVGVLSLVYLINLFLLLLTLGALIDKQLWSFFFLFLGMKTFFELVFLFPAAKFFDQKKQLYIFPLLQPFHIFYTVVAGLLGRRVRYEWKGRRVR